MTVTLNTNNDKLLKLLNRSVFFLEVYFENYNNIKQIKLLLFALA